MLLKGIFCFFIFLKAAFAQDLAAFKKMDAGYDVKKGSSLTIDMPLVRSQDGVGACSEFAAATVLDKTTCELNKISPCKTISSSPSSQASTLDLARYNKDLDSEMRGSRGNYKGLTFPGDGGRILDNVLSTGKVVTEACVSFINRVHNFEPEKERSEKEMIETWKGLQDRYRKIDPSCTDCMARFTAFAKDELQTKMNWKGDNLTDLKVFGEKSYETFLDQLLIPRTSDCAKDPSLMIRYPEKLSIETFPRARVNYDQMMRKTMEVLANNKPIIVSGLCADAKISSPSQCQYKHDFVLSGYREVCNKKNECKMMVKVHNSWGQAWQEKNDDGWCDAKEIFDRTFYREQSLTWVNIPSGTESVKVPSNEAIVQR